MSTQTQESPPKAPYYVIGGSPTVRRLVDRFYDLMESDPQYAALRDLHATDLTPMRESLAGFLNAWLGGPRDWFADRPGACIMSAHAKVAVTQDTARQWVSAMTRALDDCDVDSAWRAQIAAALTTMATGMAAGSS